MSLLQMSAYGGAMILLAAALRWALFRRLPKRALPWLWALALCRLLVPFSGPGLLPLPQPPQQPIPAFAEASAPAEPGLEGQVLYELPQQAPQMENEVKPAARQIPWRGIWLAGALAMGLFFAWQYRQGRRLFRESQPAEIPLARQWLEAHPLGRKVEIRQLDRVASPLTYGLLRPVILLPARWDWRHEQLEAALAHEWTHIRRWDGLTKLLLAAALCIHWFNPLVWLLYLLANRDLELACDEGAVRLLGFQRRGGYARALLSMEQARQAPLCSHFSKNPLETRIRAIAGMKKPDWQGWLAAGLTLALLALCFGAAPQNSGRAEAQKADLTQGERQAIQALQYRGYERMTLAEFRRRAQQDLEEKGWSELAETLWQREGVFDWKDSDEDAQFLYYTLIPLTAERWESREFSGECSANSAPGGDSAGLEYVLTLEITDGQALSVGQYEQARQGVAEGLEQLLQGKTPEQLQDEAGMILEIDQQIQRLRQDYGAPGLAIAVEYQYRPPTPQQDGLEDHRRQWERVLAPYLPLGLTTEYDGEIGYFRLYFQGREAMGLYDLEQGIWITEHSGDGFYDQDAGELYAVYQDGELTGLRWANEQEQREFSQLRRQNSAQLEAEIQRELRRNPPGSQQDYQSLLALQTAGWRETSLQQFNQRLRDWANEDEDRFQRMMEDIGSGDFRVPLTAGQRQFLQLTCDLSVEENFRQIQSESRGKPALDPQYGGLLLEKSGERAEASLWVDFTYRIKDPAAITVGRRDDQAGGFLQDVQQFWNQQTVESLGRYTRGGMLAKLEELAAGRSDENLEIHILSEDMGFEMLKWTD